MRSNPFLETALSSNTTTPPSYPTASRTTPRLSTTSRHLLPRRGRWACTPPRRQFWTTYGLSSTRSYPYQRTRPCQIFRRLPQPRPGCTSVSASSRATRLSRRWWMTAAWYSRRTRSTQTPVRRFLSTIQMWDLLPTAVRLPGAGIAPRLIAKADLAIRLPLRYKQESWLSPRQDAIPRVDTGTSRLARTLCTV